MTLVAAATAVTDVIVHPAGTSADDRVDRAVPEGIAVARARADRVAVASAHAVPVDPAVAALVAADRADRAVLARADPVVRGCAGSATTAVVAIAALAARNPAKCCLKSRSFSNLSRQGWPRWPARSS